MKKMSEIEKIKKYPKFKAMREEIILQIDGMINLLDEFDEEVELTKIQEEWVDKIITYLENLKDEMEVI